MKNSSSQEKPDLSFVNVLTVLSSIFTIVLGVIAFRDIYLKSSASSLLFVDYFLIPLFIFSLAFSVVLFFKRKMIAKRILSVILNFTAPKKAYKIKTKEIDYEFLSRTKMRHEKRFFVQVLHPSFKGILDQYKWSGNSHLSIRVKETDSYKIEHINDKYGLERYMIRLKNDMQKCENDICEMTTVIDEINDPEKKSELFLSSGVYDITKYLVLRVIFSAELVPTHLRRYEYSHYTDEECVQWREIKDDEIKEDKGKKIYEWKITNPFYGGKYSIEWAFNENAGNSVGSIPTPSVFPPASAEQRAFQGSLRF